MALALEVNSLEGIDEAHQALYKEKDGKFSLDVTGLEDTSGLKSALANERTAAKEAGKALKAMEQRFNGIDPDKVKAMMKRFENDKEAKLIAENKLDEVVQLRLNKREEEFERQLSDATTSATKAQEQVKLFANKVLENGFRKACAGKTTSYGANDAWLAAQHEGWKLDDEGLPVLRDGDGNIVIGKDGKSPFRPEEWLDGKVKTNPNWFPADGAGGGGDGDGKARNGAISRAEFDTKSPMEKAKFIKDGGKLYD